MPATTISQRRPRLRRSDCSGPGLRRARRGRGFLYTDQGGARVGDEEVLERVRSLAIPPAWKDVWICSDPWGHLQATGIDAAGRKQYLYHPRWRERRDQEKFTRMEHFARSLPGLRRALAADLEGTKPTREAVLACEAIVFDYPGKGGVRRRHQIEDPLSGDLVRALRRRRGGPPELLAYRQGRQWRGLRSVDINEYLKRHLGEKFSAKDFRTWNATVLAAVSVGADAPLAASKTARKRAVNRAVRGVSEMLGNTPAVARRSYIDPRVFDRYLSGWTIAGALGRLGEIDVADSRDRARLERAVLDLLDDAEDSAALRRAPAAKTA